MTLLVENGQGVPGADSYLSVSDANSYHASVGNDAWLELSDPEKEIFLRRASRDLDLLYGRHYDSDTLTTTQGLLWPRVSYVNRFGFTVAGLPNPVAEATAELALLETTLDVTGPDPGDGNLKLILKKAGGSKDGVELQKEFFSPTSTFGPKLRRIVLLLSSVLDLSSNLYASVARG